MASKLKLDDDQMFKLMKFKRCVADILQPKHDERFLARWLRARSWDVAAAEKMLRASMEFRKQWDVDKLLEWEIPEPIASHYCSGQSGYDKEGYPVYIVPMANVDIVGYIHSTSKQDLIKLTVKKIEQTLDAANKNGLTQLVAIFDLEDFNLKQFAWKPAVELVITLLQVYEANYPEILKVCYIINAPRLFALAYAVIKKFINEYTQSKIRIYKQESKKWKGHMLEHIAPDNLPKHYGGTMVDPDGDPKCPSKVRQGKIVAKHLYNKAQLTKETISQRDYITATVKKGKNLTLDFYVADDGCFLEWDFRTENHDIKFGISYTDEEGIVHTVMHPGRTSANVIDVTGTIPCQAPATYTVIFDNGYSMFRNKVLHYYVGVTESLNKLDLDTSNPEDSTDMATNETQTSIVNGTKSN